MTARNPGATSSSYTVVTIQVLNINDQQPEITVDYLYTDLLPEDAQPVSQWWPSRPFSIPTLIVPPSEKGDTSFCWYRPDDRDLLYNLRYWNSKLWTWEENIEYVIEWGSIRLPQYEAWSERVFWPNLIVISVMGLNFVALPGLPDPLTKLGQGLSSPHYNCL